MIDILDIPVHFISNNSYVNTHFVSFEGLKTFRKQNIILLVLPSGKVSKVTLSSLVVPYLKNLTSKTPTETELIEFFSLNETNRDSVRFKTLTFSTSEEQASFIIKHPQVIINDKLYRVRPSSGLGSKEFLVELVKK